MAEVLVVDDDEGYGPALCRFLGKLGQHPVLARNAREGLERALAFPFRLLLVDWCLPRASGLNLLRMLRQTEQHARTPMILMSGVRQEARDEARALAKGIDVFFVKGDGLDILRRHVLALLRLRPAATCEAGERIYGDLRFREASCKISVAGRPVRLNAQEFLILSALLKRPGSVLCAEALGAALWASPPLGWRHILEVRISSLRGKLGPRWAERLVCLKGLGYRLDVF